MQANKLIAALKAIYDSISCSLPLSLSLSLPRLCWLRVRYVYATCAHTPRSQQVDVVIVGNWKEQRNDKLLWFNVHISICALILLFTHTHTHTLCSGLPFSQLNVISVHRLCHACAMGSQAYDLLDATMNIDAFDWKSAEEIKRPPLLTLPSNPLYPSAICVCCHVNKLRAQTI